jgi:hypothetical protein
MIPLYCAIGGVVAVAITAILCGIDGTMALSAFTILGGLGGYAFGKWKK